MPRLPTDDAHSYHVVPCFNGYVVMWRNAGKSFPFILLRSIGSPRSNASGLWFQLVPWPLSKSFTIFHLPPPLLYYSSSSVFLLLCCPWGFQLTVYFLLGGIFSLIAICPIHFHFSSLIWTAIGYSCACLLNSLFEVTQTKGSLVISSKHLFFNFLGLLLFPLPCFALI